MEAYSQPANISARLTGLRVLVVEDEAMVAMVIEDMLADLGCDVVAVAANVPDALARAKADAIDAALLDVNLGGEKVFPVADALVERGVPFAFSTGYGPSDLAERYPGRPVIHKPYPPEDLARVLEILAPDRASG